MHLMTFVQVAQPTILERGIIMLTQAVFYNFFRKTRDGSTVVVDRAFLRTFIRSSPKWLKRGSSFFGTG